MYIDVHCASLFVRAGGCSSATSPSKQSFAHKYKWFCGRIQGIPTGTRLLADWCASCYENVLGHRGWLTPGLAARFGYYNLAAVFFSCLQQARSVLGRARVRPCLYLESNSGPSLRHLVPSYGQRCLVSEIPRFDRHTECSLCDQGQLDLAMEEGGWGGGGGEGVVC